MKRFSKAFLATFLAFCCTFSAKATHIIGGEITYKCLGNDDYEITLVVFRDCFNGIPPFDAPASIGIFSPDLGDSLGHLLLFPLNNDTLDVVLSNPCLTVPPNVCVNTAMYRGTIKLPPNIYGGYKLIYQRCCRNKLINNIVMPEDVGASFVTEITDAALLAGCNSSPTFINWPPIAICVGQPIDWDHSATDVDGDSLVYKLCWPQNGASPDFPMPQPPDVGTILNVVFNPGYGLSDFLNGGAGDPANRLRIDPKTGFVTGVPNLIGNFVVAICLEEYRNGKLLTRIQRDFQYNVADCGAPNAAFFAPEVLCGSKTVTLENKSENSSGSNWYFEWPNLTPFSDEQNPDHTFADTGQYTIALISLSANPICVDTFLQKIHVVAPQILTATASPDTIFQKQSSQLTATLPAGATNWVWASDPTLSNINGPMATASPLETTSYTVSATDVNGCETSGQVLVIVIPPPCAEPYVFFPNAFSPNGDGKNDVLRVEGDFVQEATWVIYNRWGEKVFEAKTPNDVWDGTFLGETLPPDSYGFYLRVRCVGGDETVRKGNVSLLR